MKVIVFDVPAEHGGALSILEEYYESAVKDLNKDWIFVISKPYFEEKENIKILRFPWIKKSWIHRLIFDYFIAPRLVRKNKVDEILSLQNVIIPRSQKTKQTVYLHQALPFIDYKFRLTEDKKMWIYQNVIGRIIKKSIKNADSVIVQTNWMKDACVIQTKVKAEKFEVRPPLQDIKVEKTFELNQESKKTFFYPAGASYYKNHRIIIEACKKLKENQISSYQIFFTLDGSENDHILELRKLVKNNKLPVEFIGKISKQEVFEYYSKSILLFPSYIESSPLPLSEGKAHQTVIIASNCSFSKEILQQYDKSYFFDWKESKELAKYMTKYINMKL